MKDVFIYKKMPFSECSDLLNTASTKSTTARNISNNSAKTTIQTTPASEEYLPSKFVKFKTRFNP